MIFKQLSPIDKMRKRIGKLVTSGSFEMIQSSVCGNRFMLTLRNSKSEIHITTTDKSQPDGYSREEIYRMLETVRREEKRTGWTCPEPKTTERNL